MATGGYIICSPWTGEKQGSRGHGPSLDEIMTQTRTVPISILSLARHPLLYTAVYYTVDKSLRGKIGPTPTFFEKDQNFNIFLSISSGMLVDFLIVGACAPVNLRGFYD